MKTPFVPSVPQSHFEFVGTGKPGNFFYLSAWHPGGRHTDNGANAQADEKLRQALHDKRKPAVHFRVLRTHLGGDPGEQGWGVACSEADAMELARRFRAVHIWRFSDETVAAIQVKSGTIVHSGPRANHHRDPRAILHFTLFVGSPPATGRPDPLEYAGVCTRAGALLSGFTIQRAEGCFQSIFEETLVIHIATREPGKVIALAHDLRRFLRQTGVGISHNRIYQRVREWTDDGMILETFGLGRG